MPTATQLEILDLRHFSARQLRPLLETEAAVWEDRLRWNYRSSTELLLQYLDSRILPGFVSRCLYAPVRCRFGLFKILHGDAATLCVG